MPGIAAMQRPLVPRPPRNEERRLIAVVSERKFNEDEVDRIIAALDRSNKPSNALVDAMNGADAEILRRFVASEIEKNHDRMLAEFRAGMADIGRKIATFLPDEEIERRVDRKFERIGLRVDDDHYEETGEAVRGFLKWHKRADKVLGGIAISILGAIAVALFKLVGINIPNPAGGG